MFLPLNGNDPQQTADQNLEILMHHPYPGRMIGVGLDETGSHLVQVAVIMGRSANSRNRRYISDTEGIVRTEPIDISNIEKPELTIYPAMKQQYFVMCAVSNGEQTNDALQYDLSGPRFGKHWKYEPDSYFTPRITAVTFVKESKEVPTEMVILRKSPFGDGCEKKYYYFPHLPKGMMYMVQTYDHNGDSLPSFTGEPYVLPVRGSIVEVAQTIWSALNEDNKVAIVVKFVDMETQETTIEIVNKY